MAVIMLSRLLSYAASVLKGDSLTVWRCGPDFPDIANEDAVNAMALLRQGFAVSSRSQ